ncbi:Auxin-responsive protein SAUR71, partial [Mucuna pruriens]
MDGGSKKKNNKKKKEGLMTKTWERCKSLGRGRKEWWGLSRSKSWAGPSHVGPSPEGCFSVYVGPQKQRFVIKTEYANHPLFKMLLEEAESEYGYNSQGPLALPCDVDVFNKVLTEMDYYSKQTPQGCACVRSPSAYRLLRTSSMLAINPIQ